MTPTLIRMIRSKRSSARVSEPGCSAPLSKPLQRTTTIGLIFSASLWPSSYSSAPSRLFINRELSLRSSDRESSRALRCLPASRTWCSVVWVARVRGHHWERSRMPSDSFWDRKTKPNWTSLLETASKMLLLILLTNSPWLTIPRAIELDQPTLYIKPIVFI